MRVLITLMVEPVSSSETSDYRTYTRRHGAVSQQAVIFMPIPVAAQLSICVTTETPKRGPVFQLGTKGKWMNEWCHLYTCHGEKVKSHSLELCHIIGLLIACVRINILSGVLDEKHEHSFLCCCSLVVSVCYFLKTVFIQKLTEGMEWMAWFWLLHNCVIYTDCMKWTHHRGLETGCLSVRPHVLGLSS
jgi:hypothetical protein